tara:strand:+ start:145 stop:2556 length:2412 start_codon:yes stop_codon:yes gene_type:complete
MPLNFNPYQSTYVDPGSVKISETLRTRFADNFSADDEFSESISSMIALTPDEGAKALLEDKYRAILDERADKGDYENMGMQIVRDARKFKTEYDPIKQQAAARAAIAENLKARRDKGDLTAGMYDDAMREMDADYAATGGVANQGSYNERQVSKFVNVNERIFERIKKLDKDAVGGFEVNYLNLSPQEIAARGGAGQLGVGYDPEATYTYKTKEGITKYVPPEDIQAAFNSIMDEPDVREFMLQDARYSVNRMDDKRATEVATNFAAKFRKEADETEDETRKKDLNERAAKMEAELNNPEGADIAAIRGMAQEATYYDNQTPMLKTAMAIPGVEQTGGSRLLDYDDAWLALNKDNGVLPLSAGVTGALQSNAAISGTTLNDKQAYTTKQKGILNDMQQPDYYEKTLPGITFDQLSEMTEAQFSAMRGGATPAELAIFKQQKNHQLEVMGEIAAMDKLMGEAASATGQTTEMRLSAVEELPGATSVIDQVMEAIPGASREDALGMIMRLHQYDTDMQLHGSLLLDVMNPASSDVPIDPAIREKLYEVLDFTQPVANGQYLKPLMNDMQGVLKVSDEKINGYMNEVSTRTFTPTVYTNVPGMTKQGRAEVDRVYKGVNPAARGDAFVSPTTGEMVAFDQWLAHSLGGDYIGKDGKPTEEATALMQGATQTGNVMYNPANVGNGGGTLAISYTIGTGEEKKTVEAQIPFSHVKVPAVQEYASGTSYQFLRQASMQRNHGIESPIVTVLTEEGVREKYRIDYSDLSNPVVIPLQGPKENIPMSLETSMATDGFIADLAKSGDRIVAN